MIASLFLVAGCVFMWHAWYSREAADVGLGPRWDFGFVFFVGVCFVVVAVLELMQGVGS